MEKGQAERLMPLIAELMADAGVALRDLTAIGTGTGPGNFTGIRLSVAAARGLALALGIPAIGVSGFDALRQGLAGLVLASIDARRGSLWLEGPGLPAALIAGVGHGDPPAGLCGVDVVGHRAAELALWTGGTVRPPCCPPAVGIARQAAERALCPAPRPAPLYIRPPDAALPREAAPRILAAAEQGADPTDPSGHL